MERERVIAILSDEAKISEISEKHWYNEYLNELDDTKAEAAYRLYREFKAEARILNEIISKIARLDE